MQNGHVDVAGVMVAFAVSELNLSATTIDVRVPPTQIQ